MDRSGRHSFPVEGAVGGETQEEGDQRTMADLQNDISKLEQMVRERDHRLQVQDQEISSLKCQLAEVMRYMSTPWQGTSEQIVPTTVTTTTTWTGPILTQPQVTFSSTLFSPLMSHPHGIIGKGKPDDGIKVPSTLTATCPPGCKPLVGKKESRNNAVSDLVQLDDSSDSETESSNSSVSSEVGSGSQDNVRSIVRMLGRKACPKPEVYSMESGRSFSRFLQSFEAYCEGKYSSTHKDLWTSELGRLLEGEIKQVYEAWGGPEKKYRKMKSYLEKWHSEAKERITSSRRAQYRNIKMLPGEGLRIFSTRLENLYRLAYPHRDLDGKDLKRQLLNAIPAAAAETLERDLALVRATTSRQNTWGDVLRLLEIQDESVRREAVSHQTTAKIPVQAWSGVVGNNLPMRVETVQQPMGGKQRFSQSPSEGRRSGSRSPGRLWCNWCKRPGHEYRTCRRRLNQCLRCGSDTHRVAECPKRPSKSWNKKSGDGPVGSKSGSDSESRRGRLPSSKKAGKRKSQKRNSRKGASSTSSSEERSLNADTLV